MSTPDSEPASEAGSPARRRGLLALAAVVLLAGAAWALYWHGYARWRISTDDAYVGGNIVQLTAEIPAPCARSTRARPRRWPWARRCSSRSVGRTHRDGSRRLRPGEYRAPGARHVRTGRTAPSPGRGQGRRTAACPRGPLAPRIRRERGAISAEEFAHAQESVKEPGTLRAAREDLNVALAQTEGTTPEQHPLVLRAAARVRDAGLTLQRTTIASPVNGVVGRKGVQIGQRIAPGMPLMGIVPLGHVGRCQLQGDAVRGMHIGQPVELESDFYGSKVTFSGRVVGLSAGTGAPSRCSRRRTLGQLDQDRPAGAGADRARPRAGETSAAHRPVDQGDGGRARESGPVLDEARGGIATASQEAAPSRGGDRSHHRRQLRTAGGGRRGAPGLTDR